MSDAPRDDTWWQASDGKWYPPQDQAPHPGWWLASDGNWYPPQSETDAPAERPEAAGSATGKPSRTQPAKSGRSSRPGRERAKPQPLGKTPPGASKPAPAKAPPAKVPPAKVPAAESPAAKAAPAGGASKPLPSPRPNANDGLSPQEQIKRRNLASDADRKVLAASRSLAASRLLASVGKELADDSSTTSPQTAPDLAKPAPTAKASVAKSIVSKPTALGRDTPAGPEQPAPNTATSPNDPLLEVKQSALAADVDHLGERLAIFNDRVELRDRHDAVRQVVLGSDIADIVVNKRLTGAVLTIETVEGPVMVAKGLRPEQAEEARQLIMRKTRPTGPVQRTERPATSTTGSPPSHVDVVDAEPRRTDVIVPDQTGPSAAARPIDEADVLRKLGDLHRLGILTTEEYENKIALVGSLVRGEITLPA